MANKLVAFRLPEQLIQAIEAQARATGTDRTAVVVSALKQAFGLNSDESSAIDLSIRQELTTLAQQVTNLSVQVAELQQEQQHCKYLIQQPPDPKQQLERPIQASGVTQQQLEEMIQASEDCYRTLTELTYERPTTSNLTPQSLWLHHVCLLLTAQNLQTYQPKAERYR